MDRKQLLDKRVVSWNELKAIAKSHRIATGGGKTAIADKLVAIYPHGLPSLDDLKRNTGTAESNAQETQKNGIGNGELSVSAVHGPVTARPSTSGVLIGGKESSRPARVENRQSRPTCGENGYISRNGQRSVGQSIANAGEQALKDSDCKSEDQVDERTETAMELETSSQDTAVSFLNRWKDDDKEKLLSNAFEASETSDSDESVTVYDQREAVSTSIGSDSSESGSVESTDALPKNNGFVHRDGVDADAVQSAMRLQAGSPSAVVPELESSSPAVSDKRNGKMPAGVFEPNRTTFTDRNSDQEEDEVFKYLSESNPHRLEDKGEGKFALWPPFSPAVHRGDVGRRYRRENEARDTFDGSGMSESRRLQFQEGSSRGPAAQSGAGRKSSPESIDGVHDFPHAQSGDEHLEKHKRRLKDVYRRGEELDREIEDTRGALRRLHQSALTAEEKRRTEPPSTRPRRLKRHLKERLHENGGMTVTGGPQTLRRVPLSEAGNGALSLPPSFRPELTEVNLPDPTPEDYDAFFASVIEMLATETGSPERSGKRPRDDEDDDEGSGRSRKRTRAMEE